MYAFFETIANTVVAFFADLRVDQFIQSLSYMAYGMGGIFIVVLIICLVIFLLNKWPSQNNASKKE